MRNIRDMLTTLTGLGGIVGTLGGGCFSGDKGRLDVGDGLLSVGRLGVGEDVDTGSEG